MRKTGIVVCFFLAMLSIHPAWSRLAEGAGNYWQCAAFDNQNKEWLVRSPYERVATNKALEACKRASSAPSSCRVAKERCELFVKGRSTSPLWKCTAFDAHAKKWESNVYTQQDDAALASLAYCRENSDMPDSCYINSITCHNLNGT